MKMIKELSGDKNVWSEVIRNVEECENDQGALWRQKYGVK